MRVPNDAARTVANAETHRTSVAVNTRLPVPRPRRQRIRSLEISDVSSWMMDGDDGTREEGYSWFVASSCKMLASDNDDDDDDEDGDDNDSVEDDSDVLVRW